MQTFITIIALLVTFIGLPVLILRIRDRGGRCGSVINVIFGGLALILGISIVVFVVYHAVFNPRELPQGRLTVLRVLPTLIMIGLGWRWLSRSNRGIEETVSDDFTDSREFKESMENAKSTMPYFLEQVDKNTDNAYVKFPLKTPDDTVEHIWGYVHLFKDGVFNVSLVNKPYDDRIDASGRRDVEIDAVEDWQIMLPDGKIKGAYSLVALFNHYESSGKKLNRKMRKQKSQFLDV